MDVSAGTGPGATRRLWLAAKIERGCVMPLNDYLQQTQRFMRDARQEKLNPDDLRSYINRARRLIAQETQCVRVLPYTSGQIISASVTAAGTGYSSGPTLNISAPDYPSG